MTELSNLNDVSIYIIPLLDDNITLRDISPESGFINAFTEDKNRPQLSDKIFLLYDNSVNTEESLERYLKFEHLDTVHNKRSIIINRKPYTIYCFTIVNYRKEIKELSKSGKTFSDKAKTEILQFWLCHETLEFNRRLFVSTYASTPIQAISPEEDYYKCMDFSIDT